MTKEPEKIDSGASSLLVLEEMLVDGRSGPPAALTLETHNRSSVRSSQSPSTSPISSLTHIFFLVAVTYENRAYEIQPLERRAGRMILTYKKRFCINANTKYFTALPLHTPTTPTQMHK